MLLSSFLAGYFLVLNPNYNSATVIPYEYADKHACEQAAKVTEDTVQYYVCVPTDTHVANEEFD